MSQQYKLKKIDGKYVSVPVNLTGVPSEDVVLDMSYETIDAYRNARLERMSATLGMDVNALRESLVGV